LLLLMRHPHLVEGGCDATRSAFFAREIERERENVFWGISSRCFCQHVLLTFPKP
jgi:hypothetical protein